MALSDVERKKTLEFHMLSATLQIYQAEPYQDKLWSLL